MRIDPQDVDGSLETTALTNAFILLNNSFSDLPATQMAASLETVNGQRQTKEIEIKERKGV